MKSGRSADDIEIGEVFLPVGDENTDIFDGLAITHHGGPSVVHNWLGVSDETQRQAERMAKLGLAVFAVDVYGKGVRAKEISRDVRDAPRPKLEGGGEGGGLPFDAEFSKGHGSGAGRDVESELQRSADVIGKG